MSLSWKAGQWSCDGMPISRTENGQTQLGSTGSKRTEARNVALMSCWNQLIHHKETLSTSLLKRTKGSPEMRVSFSQNITREEGRAEYIRWRREPGAMKSPPKTDNLSDFGPFTFSILTANSLHYLLPSHFHTTNWSRNSLAHTYVTRGI